MFNKIKNNIFLRKSVLMVLELISIVNILIPKSELKILFYDSLRESLEDNTEAFYSWLKANGYDKKYNLIVCVPNKKVDNELLSYSSIGILRGIYEFLTSKYVFYSFGDFRIKPTKDQIVVNLWHGTPLKNLGKLSCDVNLLKERIDNFTYVLAASDLFVPIMANAFGCDVERVKVLGHPRNDYLFSLKNTLELLGIDRNRYTKLVLWMPTFRQSKDNRFYDSDGLSKETLLPIFDSYQKLLEFDMKLQSLNVFIVIKIHPYAKFKDIQLTNIILIKNEDILAKGIRLYEFVKDFDALITDYSSIYYDFMLLDKPIGFTLDDICSVETRRGFVFKDVLNYMPGSHINNEKDMEDFLLSISNNEDKFRNERNALLVKVCKYVDDNNCKRLADELGIYYDEKTKFSRN